MKKLFTLCIIHKHPNILLGMKKRGFGAGRWNGFGGKVQEGESIEGAAKRETFEEIGITLNDLELSGIIGFRFRGKPDFDLEVHVFRCRDFDGEPTESEEMKPQWFHIDEIPYGEMWSDDRYWLPIFLSGKKFKGKFLFDESDNVLEQELEEVGEL